jgi:hypothetical protein
MPSHAVVRAAGLIVATLLFSSQLALAQFTQQGPKLVGTGAANSPVAAEQGVSVALSGDGNTAIVGGPGDNSSIGAVWVYTRSGGVWTQQGNKLVGTGAVGWDYTRSGGVWTQQGNKLVGTGAVGASYQGNSAALSADGNTAIVGGPGDNGNIGAVWVFVQPLQVTPTTDVTASGTQGGPFSPSSFSYMLSATSGSVNYSITTPSWLTASPKSGTVTTSGKTITFKINSSADKLVPNTYPGSISFNDTTTSQRSATLGATLIVNP